MKVFNKSKFEQYTTEIMTLFIDGQLTTKESIVMKLTNSKKQFILTASHAELKKLVYSYFAERYGEIIGETFKGFTTFLFKFLDEVIEQLKVKEQ